jgi:hypothetical protein
MFTLASQEVVLFSSALRPGRGRSRARASSVRRITFYEPIATAIAGDPELKWLQLFFNA